MHTSFEQLAVAGPVAGTLVIVVCGVLVTAALVGAVSLGIRVRRREPAPPRPSEQPTPPRSGPVREERSLREPNEVPQVRDEDRLTPSQLGNDPTRPIRNQSRRRQPGSGRPPGGDEK
ncbi:DUF6479 family protein [Streptomyces sp. NPDC001443]